MSEENREVDVVVVGLGPGGESAATQLAQAGLRVVAVDERLVGGECPYYGCVPSKMMIRAADVLAEARRVAGLAGDGDGAPRLGRRSHARIRDEATDRLGRPGRRRAARGRRAPRSCAATAGSTGPRTVEVGRRRRTTRPRGVVLNTGTAPVGAADRRARGHAVLDQPRRRADRGRCPGR